MLIDSIRSNLDADEFTRDDWNHVILHHAFCSTSKGPHKDYSQFTWHGNLHFLNNLQYILGSHSRLLILQHCHNVPMARHYGVYKTWVLLELYIRSCDACCCSKCPRH